MYSWLSVSFRHLMWAGGRGVWEGAGVICGCFELSAGPARLSAVGALGFQGTTRVVTLARSAPFSGARYWREER